VSVGRDACPLEHGKKGHPDSLRERGARCPPGALNHANLHLSLHVTGACSGLRTYHNIIVMNQSISVMDQADAPTQAGSPRVSLFRCRF
jgi:hypothetical protein